MRRWLPRSTSRSRAVKLPMPSGMVPNCGTKHANRLAGTLALLLVLNRNAQRVMCASTCLQQVRVSQQQPHRDGAM